MAETRAERCVLPGVFNAKKLEPRRDLRVQIRLPLTLRGKRRDGTDFEARVSTENVSKSIFLCASGTSLEEASSVEVFLLEQESNRPVLFAALASHQQETPQR